MSYDMDFWLVDKRGNAWVTSAESPFSGGVVKVVAESASDAVRLADEWRVGKRAIVRIGLGADGRAICAVPPGPLVPPMWRIRPDNENREAV